MHEALQLPTRTRDVRAVDRGLILVARYRRSTDRAVVRHSPRLLAAGALFGDRRDDLRNHLAGPLHLHPVALTKILGDDEILVVQCRQLHDHSADLDRLELGVWIQRAGSTDIDLDFEQSGFGDVRGESSRASGAAPPGRPIPPARPAAPFESRMAALLRRARRTNSQRI